MASIELEPSIKQALRFLHSTAHDSIEQERLLLDDVIRHNCGSSKTMANVLPKKYLAEERSENYQKHKHKGDQSSKSGSGKTVPPPRPSPQQIQIPERPDDEGSSVMDGDLALELLEEDLTCAVCGQISVQAGNTLVECDACHALYHQECHKPAVKDGEAGSGWNCGSCSALHGYPVGPKSGPSSGSSSAKSSPGKHAQTSTTTKIPASLPNTVSSSSSSSSKVVTPNINIISADKRLQIMKKKAAKQQENKRKHSK